MGDEVEEVKVVSCPSVVVAGGHVLGACSAEVHGEVQRCHRVAANGIGGSKCGRRSGGSVACTMPSVAVASSDGLDTCSAEVHGEV